MKQLRVLGLAAVVAAAAAWTLPAHPTPHTPQAVRYTAHLSGASEVPPNASKASGTATFELNGNELHYSVTVQDLSGPATMAHIHVGKEGASGPHVYSFTIEKVASGTLAEGTIDLTKEATAGVSGDSLRTLVTNGAAYVNVHTAAHPGGEVRGQVLKGM